MEAKMGRAIVSMARQSGKTTYQQIINQIAKQMSDTIDQDIINGIFNRGASYRVLKSWRNRRGILMYRVAVGHEILTWIKTEHSQFGISNPDWWLFEGNINISDRLFSLLVLQYGIEK